MIISSPWGGVQSQNEIAPGIVSVSTAGHGGIMVNGYVVKLLSEAAKSRAIHHNGFYCFEEDCAWAIATLELKELQTERLKKYAASINKTWGQVVMATISEYYPEYLVERGFV